MRSDNKKDTISKYILLNWLGSADQEVSIVQLGQFLSAKTNGRYSIVKIGAEADILEATDLEIKDI